jgi:hypothetical protein
VIQLRGFIFILIAVTSVFAWKVPTHVAIANQTLDELKTAIKTDQSPSNPDIIVFHGIELHLNKTEAYQALLDHEEYFRMGVSGPDAFPDMVSGQMYLHTNNGELSDSPIQTKTKLEERGGSSRFRSVDYAMFMLKKADETNDPKILAFALGYLGHCVGDGFAHTFINEYSGGFFDYFGGNGLFGTLSEEVKHIAAEGYIDHSLPINLTSTVPAIQDQTDSNHYYSNMDRMVVKAPYTFLDSYFSGKYENTNSHVGGALYDYFEMQIDAINAVQTSGSSIFNTLNGFGKLDVGSADLFKYLFRAMGWDWLDVNIPGVGNGLDYAAQALNELVPFAEINPLDMYLDEIDDNVEDMKHKIRSYRRNWIVMSECVIQNGIMGSNPESVDHCLTLNNDETLDYMGVDGSDLELFKREIKALFILEEEKDYHKLSDNVERAAKYLVSSFKLIDFNEILIPSGARLAWSDFKVWLEDNNNPIVDVLFYGPATVIYEAGLLVGLGLCAGECFMDECLFSYPQCVQDRQNSCSSKKCEWAPFILDWVCEVVVDGACYAGAGTWCLGEVTFDCTVCNLGCTAEFAEETFKNVIDFDGTGKLADAMDAITNALDDLKALIMEKVQEALCPVAIKFGAPLEEIYKLIAIYRTLEDLSENGKYGMVNFAFLQEDLQNTEWNSRLATEANSLAAIETLNQIKSGDFEFLNSTMGGIDVKIPKHCLDFSAGEGFQNDPTFELISTLNSIANEPGPTMQKLLSDIGSDLPNTLLPFYNSVQGHKLLGLLSQNDIEGFVADAGIANNDFLPWKGGQSQYSEVCTEDANRASVFCDAIQSLDDPDCIGCIDKGDAIYPLTHEWLSGNLEVETVNLGSVQSKIAYRRSVVAWNIYNPYADNAKDWTLYTHTPFMFANSEEVVNKLYPKIFRVPNAMPGFTSMDDEQSLWNSNQADIQLDTENSSQGSASMAVCGSGWMEVTSGKFNTAEFGQFSREIKLDIYLPSPQPNPYWQGALQLQYNNPAANVYNAWLGQVELTQIPVETWVTIVFTVPDQVYNSISGDYPNAEFQLNFNVNETGKCVNVDYFRFSGELEQRTQFHVVGSRDLIVIGNSLFSFDKLSDWTSSYTTLISDAQIKEEGLASLSLNSKGYAMVKSREFNTNELRNITNKLNVDVFVPNPQPNPWWVGTVQVFLTCPQASVYNTYLGQKDLTHFFYDEFNSLTLDLSNQIVSVLSQSNINCEIGIVLNVNNGAPDFKLDNMGFINELGVMPSENQNEDLDPNAGGSTPSGGVGANFNCIGACLGAIQVNKYQTMNLGTTNDVWFVVDQSIAGWQASEMSGRSAMVNGIAVSFGQMPLPAAVNGKYYFHYSAGAHPWASWSMW